MFYRLYLLVAHADGNSFRWITRLILLAPLYLCGCTIIQPDSWPVASRSILLTFDDGPNGRISELLLDVLKKHGVKATFCYVGRNVEKYPGIVKRALDEGHVLAIHSYSRRFPTFFEFDLLAKDVESTRAAIQKAANQKELPISLYRPPSGIVTPTVLALKRRMNLEVAYISFYIHDPPVDGSKASNLMKKMRKAIEHRNGAAIVFHESRFKPNLEKDNAIDKNWLPYEIDKFIQWAKDNNYRFLTYSDLPKS